MRTCVDVNMLFVIYIVNEFDKGPVCYLSPWERGEDFSGDHLIFRRTKGGISRNWEPKRGDHWKLSKDSEGGPVKFAWKMKIWAGGSRKSSKVIRKDHFSEVTYLRTYTPHDKLFKARHRIRVYPSPPRGIIFNSTEKAGVIRIDQK